MRTFGLKRDEVIGGWRKLNKEELHNLYPSPDIIRMMTARRIRWAGHVARMKGKRTADGVLVGKRGKYRLLERPRRRSEDSIRIDIGGIGWCVMDWI
jgi:hypothetical protein